MNNGFISVIVCTYNQEKTICRTLDGILRQRCHLPVEIVVGDDGSSDGTPDILRRYADDLPDVFQLRLSPVNRGFTHNYFDCLRACRGTYIADCAGDDYWTDPTKLEQQSRLLESDPTVGLVHTDWQRLDEQTGTLRPAPPREDVRDRDDLLCQILTPASRPAIHLCTALFRRQWVLQAMQEHPRYFDAEAYRCEDIQISFLLARMGRVEYIDRPTLAYSSGGTTVSNPASEDRQFRFWENVTRLSFDLASEFHISGPRLDRFLQARLYKLLMHAFRSGNASLRRQALQLQSELHIASSRRILLAKLLTHPLLWPLTLPARNLLVRLKR